MNSSSDNYRHRKTREKPSVQYPWEVHRSSKGQLYYYNIRTNRSQWERPRQRQFSLIFHRKYQTNISRRSDRWIDTAKRKRKDSRMKLSIPEKQIDLLTPRSPPENEKIPLELVDPILTSSQSLTQISSEKIESFHLQDPSKANRSSILNQFSFDSNQYERLCLLNNQISLRKDLLSIRLNYQGYRLQFQNFNYLLANQENSLSKVM